LANKLEEERRRNVIGGSSHVILVLGYSATISDSDHSQSAKIITRFKQENPGNGTLILQQILQQKRKFSNIKSTKLLASVLFGRRIKGMSAALYNIRIEIIGSN